MIKFDYGFYLERTYTKVIIDKRVHMLGSFFRLIFLIGIAVLTIYMMCNNSLPTEKNKLNNPSLTEDVSLRILKLKQKNPQEHQQLGFITNNKRA